MNNLVLSIFPGIDLLGRAFEEYGFCVVRGPDLLWGGDIKTFHPPAGVFGGVIGGPPCQCFSRLRFLNPLAGKKHGNMIPEFERGVEEAQPDWWLMENVPQAPHPQVVGYFTQSILVNNRWVGGVQKRERVFTFGSTKEARLNVEFCLFEQQEVGATVLAGHGPVGRGGSQWDVQPTIRDIAILQGLPEDFLSESPFTVQGKRKVIGNGVPIPMGRAMAKAVKGALIEKEVT